jgi:pimeloyl-ACP methyl ester carboxylesterase
MWLAIVVGVGLALGVLLLVNFLATRATLRPPRTPFFITPRDLGLPYQNVAFPSRDGIRLHGWWLPAPKPVGIAILCHGYLMNRCEPLPVARELWQVGFHCLVFDFRAMGKSEGNLCTIGDLERLDVLSAVDFATRTAPDLPVVVYGASMGGAAAILAAAEDTRIRAVVADSAYARLNLAVKDWWRNAVGKASFCCTPRCSSVGSTCVSRPQGRARSGDCPYRPAPRAADARHARPTDSARAR